MKPVILVCCAVVFYAASNIIVERKLASIPTASLLLCSFPLMWTLALMQAGNMKLSDKPLDLPSGTLFIIVVLNATLWFLADYCYLSAYNSGGSAVTITTLVAIIPAVIMIAKYICFGHTSNLYHICGWIAAAIAIFLVTKGEMVSKTSS